MRWYERTFQKVKNFLTTRSDSLRDREFWMNQIFEKTSSRSTEWALKVSTVYACNRILSETISTLPYKCYERTSDGGKEEYSSYFLTKVIRHPNILQNRLEYIESIITWVNMRGNHYSAINFKKGYPTELIPLNSSLMNPKIKNGKLFYEYNDERKGLQIYQPWQILHNKNLTLDYLNGLSPISFARKTIDLSIESEDHGYRYFKNGARVSGFLQHPGNLSEGAQNRLKKTWNKQTTGEEKFKIQVLEEGMQFKEASLSNEDSQYLQTRQFQVEDIARWYGIPLELLQHPAKTASYNSVEQFLLSFVIHSIRPRCKKTEDKTNFQLVPEEDQDRVFFEFDLDGLLRGDIVSRYKAYATGRQWGWLSADDVRAKENQNPLPNNKGKTYLMPLNMEDVENPRKPKGGKNA